MGRLELWRRRSPERRALWRLGACVAVAVESLLVGGVADANATLYSPAPGSPLEAPGGGSYGGVVFDPAGRFVVRGTEMFSVEPSGALALVGPLVDPCAGAVAFSPDGKLLAAADDGTVSTCSVSRRGALTPVAGSQITVSSGYSLAFNSNGTLLAVKAVAGDQLYVFSVSASGALTPVGGSPFAVNQGGVAFSPTANLLAITSYPDLSMYTVSATGALTPVPGSPFSDPVGANQVEFSPNGSLLATAGPGGVITYSVGSSGDLTPVDKAGPGGGIDASAAFSPDGSTLAVTLEEAAEMATIPVTSTGELGTPTYYPTLANAEDVAFGPTGELATPDLTLLVPGTTSSTTAWPGSFGADGYDLAAFNNGGDLIHMPYATVNLIKGSRTLWATDTTNTGALESPDGSTRNAAAYTDPHEVEVALTFRRAYTGDLRLYAFDWNNSGVGGSGLEENIDVNNGSTGIGGGAFFHSAGDSENLSDPPSGWALVPIDVTAGQTLTITVTNAGLPFPNRDVVLDGIFLGNGGRPPGAGPSSGGS